MIKRIFYTSLVIFVLAMTITLTASAQEYIVKMKDTGVTLFSCGAEPLYAEKNLYVTDEETAKALMNSGMAEYIEPNGTVTLFSTVYEDVYADEIAASSSLKTVSAQAAWYYDTFGNDVVIGVIDSGCFPHSDIKDNLVQGKNFLDGCDESDTTDTFGHGTHVCGIIAASLNGTGDSGVAGVAPYAKIVPLLFTNGAEGSFDEAIAAIYSAVDEFNCDIISMSWGTSAPGTSMQEAIEYADSKGVILVAAAGNDGKKTASSYANTSTYAYHDIYPAAYDCVIGVGSVNDSNVVSDFSQKSTASVTLCAPGYNVNSLALTDGAYRTDSGTSMSCPHVAAAAAVALSFDPTLSPAEMKALLSESVHEATGAYAEYSGAGVLDIDIMVQNLLYGRAAYTSPLVKTDSGISSNLFNLTEDVMNADQIWYGSDRLVSTPFTVEADGKITLSTNLTSARLFVWDSLSGMIPYAHAR